MADFAAATAGKQQAPAGSWHPTAACASWEQRAAAAPVQGLATSGERASSRGGRAEREPSSGAAGVAGVGMLAPLDANRARGYEDSCHPPTWRRCGSCSCCGAASGVRRSGSGVGGSAVVAPSVPASGTGCCKGGSGPGAVPGRTDSPAAAAALAATGVRSAAAPSGTAPGPRMLAVSARGVWARRLGAGVRKVGVWGSPLRGAPPLSPAPITGALPVSSSAVEASEGAAAGPALEARDGAAARPAEAALAVGRDGDRPPSLSRAAPALCSSTWADGRSSSGAEPAKPARPHFTVRPGLAVPHLPQSD